MKLAKDTIDEFFEIPIGITEDLVHDIAEGLEQLFQEYTTFVASCGKQNIQICIPQELNLLSLILVLFRSKTKLHPYITSSYKMQQRFQIR